MKKVLSSLVAALAVAAVVVGCCCFNCNEKHFAGEWKYYYINDDDELADLKEGGATMTVTLKEDKTFVFSWVKGDVKKDYLGTWKLEGKKLVFNYPSLKKDYVFDVVSCSEARYLVKKNEAKNISRDVMLVIKK